MTQTKKFAAVQPHGEIDKIFDDVYFVQGSLAMPAPVKITMSRNMTIVREGDELTLINTVRLDEQGLSVLDKLGKVKHVIRIAGFHGMDDPFYQDHYGAKVWAIKGQDYVRGFNNGKPGAKTYFDADIEIDVDTVLPIDAKMSFFASRPSEGLLILDKEGGIAVSGDSLQNWQKTDAYMNLLGKIAMKMMKFIRPYNVGPGWLGQAKPPKDDIKAVLDLTFAHLLPAHGVPVVNDAKEKFRASIERASS